MTSQDQQLRRTRSRIVDEIIYVLALPSAALLCGAWLFSSHVYYLDLLVSQQILIMWWCVFVLIVAVVFRRWRAAFAMPFLTALAVYPLVQSRTVFAPDVDFGSKSDDAIRVVSCNINPKSELWEHAVEDLLDLDADVVIVLEVPPNLSRKIRRQGWIGNDAYAHWAHRYWVDQETSPGYVLSRWPIEQLDLGLDAKSQQQILHVRIDHPDGAFVAGLIHPFSPRDRDRWAYGNDVTRLQARIAERTHHDTGLPIIFGVDLNAGFAQDRARVLRSAGLRPSKPMTRIGGTYPSNTNLPRALTLQLDDVWVMGDATIDAWSSIEVLGSDHRAVVVDIRFDEK